jgi:MFS family permease
MWRLGFFFHEMAFGLLSIFLPLYIVEKMGGTLVDIGVMTAVALFLAIPASYLWGYACDKTKRYKRYVLISFLSLTVLLYLFTLARNVEVLITLYVIMAIFHAAHEPPKNVLIAELYSRKDWEKTFASYEGFTEVGWLIGLLLGFLTAAYGISSASTLLLCSGLNLIAFALSLVLIADPLLVFERSLVTIEKTVDFAYKGVVIASKIFGGLSTNERLKKESLSAFCSGVALFSLASTILFTPLPIFFSANLALPASLIFAVYVLNSGGGVAGYLLARSKSHSLETKTPIGKAALFRSGLTFLLIALAFIPAYGTVGASTILILLGLAYALFIVSTEALSMELVPTGKAGLFNVVIGIGGAFGSFIGPFIAQTLGFTLTFLVSGVIFFASYVSFKFFG